VLQTYVAMQQNDYQRLNAPTYSSNAAQFTFNTEGYTPKKGSPFLLSETRLSEVFNAFYEAEILIDLTKFKLNEKQLSTFAAQAEFRRSLNLAPLFIQTPDEIYTIWGKQYLYECENPESTPVVFEQKELSDYTISSRDLLIVARPKALNFIKNDNSRKIIICESSCIETIENSELRDFTVCTYSDISKLSIDILQDTNVYVFGSQNFVRQRFTNSLNEVEKLFKYTNVVLFADTPTYLNIARRIITIDKPILNTQIIVSDVPQSTFVETVLACSPEDVLFLDTHESLNKQLTNYQKVKRSELYAADHNKPLFVLFDNAVQLLPEAFSQFTNVVFIANNETKPCVDMSTFCASMSKMATDALAMLDNETSKGLIEKMFFEAVKNQTLAIRRNENGWERCLNTEGVLEHTHQVKCLVSDAGVLKRHVEKFANTNVKVAEITEETAEITADIKQSKIDIAAEKKTEFFEFLQNVEDNNIESINGLNDYVARQKDVSRGAKIAYTRLKILLKVNPNFSTCFEAVKDSYVGWTKTKGRFLAAKIIKTNTKTANNLQTFRDTTEGGSYPKLELLEIARATLPMIKGNDTEAWKQLKRICHLPNKQVMKDGNRGRLYEVLFLE
jgi:hypothetical protein